MSNKYNTFRIGEKKKRARPAIRPLVKKVDPKYADFLVMNIILRNYHEDPFHPKSFHAEDLAKSLRCPVHQITQAIHRIRIKHGLIGKKHNDPPMDSDRHPWTSGGGDSMWTASSYPIDASAVRQFLKKEYR